MITISLDVLKLDKARFKEVTRRDGSRALFCDLVLFETQSEYGDWIVKQAVTKEEREKRVEMPILGNGKNFQKGQSRRAPVQQTQPEPDGPPPF